MEFLPRIAYVRSMTQAHTDQQEWCFWFDRYVSALSYQADLTLQVRHLTGGRRAHGVPPAQRAVPLPLWHCGRKERAEV
jgi:hypothetical protein